MDVPVKVFLFFLCLLSAAKSLETDYITEADENTRHFILEQNELMKNLIKEEMQKQFAASETRILSQLGSKKNQLSASFNETVVAVERRTISELGSKTDKLERMLSYLFPIRVRTEVEEVSGNNGSIEFIGGVNLAIRRKIWVLWAEGENAKVNLRFLMEENNLGEDAHLSLWDSGSNIHVWNGSQIDWRKERRTGGSLVLLTLTVKPSATPGPPPSFKLSFTSTNTTSLYDHSSEIITKYGVESISFPHQNAQNYSPKSLFQAVIAPQIGRPFSLTLKYLDAPGTPPYCWDNAFYVYFLEESQTETNYKKMNKSNYTECGRLGNVSQFLGTSTVAVVQFYSMTDNTGRGFRVEMKPTN